ncbi:MAG TPA: S41 family peptidase, partial [Chloroflexota bacterium]|nr:S41 family peptidase [Chloroflexota bacterium]
AWSWVDREFYDRGALDTTKITYGAIRGMFETLGDRNSYFVDPQEREVSETQLRGGFQGIGANVELTADGKVRIVAPQEGSPAEEAGIRAGDIILQVDGRSIEGMNLIQAVALIRGPKGTKVRLTLQRDGEAEPLTIEVSRADIKVESVRSRSLDQNVAYVRVSQFGQQTAKELREAIQGLSKTNPSGLVLDLRGNPGGYLVSAVDAASLFLEDGAVLYELRGNGERQEYRVKRGNVATTLPMVVLVDRGSASAAEIVAGALQDHQRARLVGEKTFGKGSMQSVHVLSDGSSVHVTIAHWLTPNERPIDGNGLLPDVAVELPEAPTQGSDAVLEKAVEMLTGGKS